MANKPSSLTNIFYHRWILPLEVPESLSNLAFTNQKSAKQITHTGEMETHGGPGSKSSFTGLLWLLISDKTYSNTYVPAVSRDKSTCAPRRCQI